jgi:thioredoxin 1
MITINYFSAAWCGPCKMFAPIVEVVSQEENVPVIKIDIEQNQDMTKAYDVRSVPTLVLMKNGTPVARHTGIMGKAQLQQFINAHK